MAYRYRGLAVLRGASPRPSGPFAEARRVLAIVVSGDAASVAWRHGARLPTATLRPYLGPASSSSSIRCSSKRADRGGTASDPEDGPKPAAPVKGVRYDQHNDRWIADFTTPDGTRVRRSWTAKKYGAEQARQLAEAARALAVEQGAVVRVPGAQHGDHAVDSSKGRADSTEHGGRAVGGSVLPATVSPLDPSSVRQLVSGGRKVQPAKHQCDVKGVKWNEQDSRWEAQWKDINTDQRHILCFPTARHGFEGAKQLAIAARQQAEQRGEARVEQRRGRSHSTAHQSDVPGVTYCGTPVGQEMWRTSWYRHDGSRVFKSFAIGRYGYAEAKALAEAARRGAEAQGEVRYPRGHAGS